MALELQVDIIYAHNPRAPCLHLKLYLKQEFKAMAMASTSWLL